MISKPICSSVRQSFFICGWRLCVPVSSPPAVKHFKSSSLHVNKAHFSRAQLARGLLKLERSFINFRCTFCVKVKAPELISLLSEHRRMPVPPGTIRHRAESGIFPFKVTARHATLPPYSYDIG
jgi:hypothetical protein